MLPAFRTMLALPDDATANVTMIWNGERIEIMEVPAIYLSNSQRVDSEISSRWDGDYMVEGDAVPQYWANVGLPYGEEMTFASPSTGYVYPPTTALHLAAVVTIDCPAWRAMPDETPKPLTERLAALLAEGYGAGIIDATEFLAVNAAVSFIMESDRAAVVDTFAVRYGRIAARILRTADGRIIP